VDGQIPRGGTLSAWDKVTLVLQKAQHGVVPRVIGLTVAQARAKLAPLKLKLRVTGSRSGKVVSQQPRWGVAAAPGMRVVARVKPAAKPAANPAVKRGTAG
jgi:beta-lactam-binding protein with PASTA domain